MDLGLSGKRVFVTGGASGMGKATAQLFAGEGAVVAIADMNASGAADTAATISAEGGEASPYELDVTKRSSWEATITQAERDLGPIDVLCNIAGPGARTGHIDTDDAEWERQIAGHLNGVFYGCTTVLPGMIDRGAGKIVNMGSFTAHGVSANIPGYCAAFGGIVAYSKDLARFAAPYGINVNCVSPGNIDTPMTRSGWLEREGEIDRLRERMPIKRVGEPKDVANWFVFLASDQARHAVGIEISVSGGQLIY